MKKRFFWLGPMLLSLLLFFLFYSVPRISDIAYAIGQYLLVLNCIAYSAFAKWIVDVKLKEKYTKQIFVISIVEALIICLIYYSSKVIDYKGILVILIPDLIVILYLLFKMSSQIDKDKQ